MRDWTVSYSMIILKQEDFITVLHKFKLTIKYNKAKKNFIPIVSSNIQQKSCFHSFGNYFCWWIWISPKYCWDVRMVTKLFNIIIIIRDKAGDIFCYCQQKDQNHKIMC